MVAVLLSRKIANTGQIINSGCPLHRLTTMFFSVKSYQISSLEHEKAQSSLAHIWLAFQGKRTAMVLSMYEALVEAVL